MNRFDKDMMDYRKQIAGDKEQIHKIDLDKKSAAQKIDGDMGSFYVMSEPVKMSVLANKVNRHAADRSTFKQTIPEVDADSAATERLNAGIKAQNAAEVRINEARNSIEKMEINRINAARIGETITSNRPQVETTTTKKKND